MLATVILLNYVYPTFYLVNLLKGRIINQVCLPHYLTMIQSFGDKGSEDIFNGEDTKVARKVCPQSLWKVASRKLDLLDSALSLDELLVPPGNHLEALKGNRKGQHSIRINDQYRICFTWSETGPSNVEIVDYH